MSDPGDESSRNLEVLLRLGRRLERTRAALVRSPASRRQLDR